MNEFRLFPQQASTVAPDVDSLYFFLIAVTTFFTLLIFVLIVYLGLKYRRRPGVKPQKVATSFRLEMTWTIIPFVLTMVMFAWGAKVYVTLERPPADAMVINVIGRQWMWKLQHPEGVREINTLHIPVGRPVKLVMTSQDVIHGLRIEKTNVHIMLIPGQVGKATVRQERFWVARFQIQRMANGAVEKLRKRRRKDLSARQRLKLKDERFMLLKRQHDLDAAAMSRMLAWFQQFPLLGEAHALKEGFLSIWDQKDRPGAEAACER